MKERNGLVLLVGLLAMAIFFGWAWNKEACAQQIELRLATWNPPPPDVGDIAAGIPWYANELEKRTQGRVKIKVFWSGSLIKQMEAPRGIKSGMTDMGTVVGVYHPELFPYGMGASQATMVLAATELGDWIKPYRQLMKEYPEVLDTYAKQNQKMLAFWEYDRMSIISTKPIRNLADAKGVKIRNSGESLPRMFRAVGFNPISLPATEAYDAVQRGMVDAIHATPDTALKYRWYEPCKYYTETPVFGTALVFFMSINLDAWKKLPPDVQKVMVQLGDELTDLFPTFARKTREDFKKAFTEAGGKFITFSEADQKEWKAKVAKDAMEFYLQKMEAKGIPKVREIVYRLAELVNYKWK